MSLQEASFFLLKEIRRERKKNILLLGLIFIMLTQLSGCELIRVEKADFKPSSPLRFNDKAQHLFNPMGKEQFSLKAKAKNLQAKGYVKFCHTTNITRCNNRLPYVRFTGMRGYFDSQTPFKTDHESYEYYPVVFENGDKFFFLSLKVDGGKYGRGSPIKSISLNDDFKPRPVLAGLSINIVGEYTSFGAQYYRLSNQDVVEKNQLSLIQKLSKDSKDPEKMIQLLLKTKIEYNDIYDSFLVSSQSKGTNNAIKLVIGINEAHKWLRFSVKRAGDKKIGLNAYTLAADSKRWRSSNLPFENTQQDDQFVESFEITANNKEADQIGAMAKASRATIRLHGTSKSTYHVLRKAEKEQLSNILDLYSLLNKDYL